MNLSSVPPWARRMSTIFVRYSFSISTTSSGSEASEIEVKPRMSEKRMVRSRRSPPRWTFSGWARMWSRICGET
jgi:hypothetical protein